MNRDQLVKALKTEAVYACHRSPADDEEQDWCARHLPFDEFCEGCRTNSLLQQASDLLAAVDQIQPGEAQLRQASQLIAWMRRKASILRQPPPKLFTRAFGDDDYAAFAQALEDGATALQAAEGEVSQLAPRVRELTARAEAAEASLQALQQRVETVVTKMRALSNRVQAEYRSGDREPGTLFKAVSAHLVDRWVDELLLASLTQPGAAGQE